MPARNKLHQNELLAKVQVKYSNSEYIASRVFPFVDVKKDSDDYRIYVRDFRLPETARANKGVARTHDFDISTASYTLRKHALKEYRDRDWETL